MKDYDGRHPIYIEPEPAKFRHFAYFGFTIAGFAAGVAIIEQIFKGLF